MLILAIESSCDETSVAVVKDGREVLSCATYSQLAEHAKYGGVVPEIASRLHTETIVGLTRTACESAGITLSDTDAVAVTAAPGLIGALLVGVNFAKGLALAADKPLVPVHHIRGHIASCYLSFPELTPPFMCFVASGGHSHIIKVNGYTSFELIGRTRDDAAGECFDKAARALGLPHPGGVNLDRLGRDGDPHKYPFPKPKVEGAPYDMSFSGLKTSVLNLINRAEQKGEDLDRPSVAASFNNTIAEIVRDRFFAAAAEHGMNKLALVGGVAANSRIRAMLTEQAAKAGAELYLPELKYCGDNAAMIGAQAYYEYADGSRADMSLNAFSTMDIRESF